MRTNKEAIVAEYLTGDYTYLQLGAKYGLKILDIRSPGEIVEYED